MFVSTFSLRGHSKQRWVKGDLWGRLKHRLTGSLPGIFSQTFPSADNLTNRQQDKKIRRLGNNSTNEHHKSGQVTEGSQETSRKENKIITNVKDFSEMLELS